MENCQQCWCCFSEPIVEPLPSSFDLNSVSFDYKRKLQKIDLCSIINRENQEIILENINQGEDDKFIHILNEIKNKFEKINEKKINALKESLKVIISNIKKDKNKIEDYKDFIDKSTQNNFDLKHIKYFCDIFKSFYEAKNELDKEDIKYFIKSLKNALKEANILKDEDFGYFIQTLNKIFLNNNNDNFNKIKSIFTEEVEDKYLIKTAPLLIHENDDFENLDQKTLKANSNFSKNSEEYKKEIFKLKRQNKYKDKKIELLHQEIIKYQNYVSQIEKEQNENNLQKKEEIEEKKEMKHNDNKFNSNNNKSMVSESYVEVFTNCHSQNK